LNIASHIVLDGKQHDIATRRPAIRDGPLHFDKATDPAQVLDKSNAFIVRRMNYLDAEPAKIAKDLDRHHLLPRSEPSG
jgi:hypothetical protein